MYKSDSEGEDDPIVSGPIIPMTVRIKIRIKITVASSGSNGILMTLLDSGCTKFLISPQVVEKLGMRLRKLESPMAFSHVDGSIVGGTSATYLTEPVELKGLM